MKNGLILFVAFFIFLLVFSCKPYVEYKYSYYPVYFSSADTEIKMNDPVAIEEVSRAFITGDYVFLVKPLEGIHVINFTNKLNPINQGFIQLKGCKEVEIKDQFLFVQQHADLVTLNISNIYQLVINRIPEFFQPYDILPPKGSFFECPDPTKGIIVDWILENELTKHDCKR